MDWIDWVKVILIFMTPLAIYLWLFYIVKRAVLAAIRESKGSK